MSKILDKRNAGTAGRSGMEMMHVCLAWPCTGEGYLDVNGTHGAPLALSERYF